MRVFHCDHCRNLVFFENTFCVHCERRLAYLPTLGVVGSLDPVSTDGEFESPLPRAAGRTFRLCANYTHHNVCNWVVDGEHALCRSCRFTRTIPDLSLAGNLSRWGKLEAAKRRLLYTLIGLRLPLANREEDPKAGLHFEFLADSNAPTEPVLTGHDDGVITVNIAEADDAEREKRRVGLGEPYRTLLGHFRHEVGHYYWSLLIDNSERIGAFRDRFGDERADYGEALKTHYEHGPAANWQQSYVSSYASSHPWEDWAETWAHYLHITDTVETASNCGLALEPAKFGEPSLQTSHGGAARPFDQLIENWFPLTYVLNNLNRGMGLPDAYPFVLPPVAIEKLHFVHETIAAVQAT